MTFSSSHTRPSEVEALVLRLFNEDKGRQDALLELAFRFEDSCALHLSMYVLGLWTKYSHRTREGIGCSSSHANCYLTEKELHQLRMDEEALRETLEEEAMNKKAQEEKIRQRQAEDDKFFLEFGPNTGHLVVWVWGLELRVNG
ncbi:hypothetical protein Tco_1066588 [Tanacetum coccineum]|uniref:Uncharacterized protein n=1 Tax=Tanacetum coccineum TaxID=301880 RepID=A0ABQ5HAH1_9ASTR